MPGDIKWYWCTVSIELGNMGARLEIWDTSHSCRGHDEVLDWDENTAGFLEARDVNMLGFDSSKSGGWGGGVGVVVVVLGGGGVVACKRL